jgi:hypothetical protein
MSQSEDLFRIFRVFREPYTIFFTSLLLPTPLTGRGSGWQAVDLISLEIVSFYPCDFCRPINIIVNRKINKKTY